MSLSLKDDLIEKRLNITLSGDSTTHDRSLSSFKRIEATLSPSQPKAHSSIHIQAYSEDTQVAQALEDFYTFAQEQHAIPVPQLLVSPSTFSNGPHYSSYSDEPHLPTSPTLQLTQSVPDQLTNTLQLAITDNPLASPKATDYPSYKNKAEQHTKARKTDSGATRRSPRPQEKQQNKEEMKKNFPTLKTQTAKVSFHLNSHLVPMDISMTLQILQAT